MMRMERLTTDIETARRRLIQSLFAIMVVFVLFEALRGEQSWSKVKAEGNLWNYGSSLQYFVAGELAFVNALLVWYAARLVRLRRRSWSFLPWTAAGAGFTFFACDEMLEVHEKIGLRIEQGIPWLAEHYSGHADNLIIFGYGLGALVFAAALFKSMLLSRPAKAYFLAGMISIGTAVMMDLVPRDLYILYLPLRETEELLELLAGFLFAASFLSAAAFSISRILGILDVSGPDCVRRSDETRSVPHG